jgi:hypothetical protein
MAGLFNLDDEREGGGLRGGGENSDTAFISGKLTKIFAPEVSETVPVRHYGERSSGGREVVESELCSLAVQLKLVMVLINISFDYH